MLFRNRFLEYLWFLARVMEDGITDSDEFSSHCIPEASQYTDMRSRRMLEIWICIWFDDMEIARKKKKHMDSVYSVIQTFRCDWEALSRER